MAYFKCGCGKVFSKRLKCAGKSCGCLQRASAKKVCGENFRTHGKRRRPEYNVWAGMKQRCFNENARFYELYGGRGITVCDRWKDSFENFYADMGPRPTGTTIDRIDVNGDYIPENCRWVADKTQQNNRRNNITLTHNGEGRTMSEWADRLGWSYMTIALRYNRGWPVERILGQEPRKRS